MAWPITAITIWDGTNDPQRNNARATLEVLKVVGTVEPCHPRSHRTWKSRGHPGRFMVIYWKNKWDLTIIRMKQWILILSCNKIPLTMGSLNHKQWDLLSSPRFFNEHRPCFLLRIEFYGWILSGKLTYGKSPFYSWVNQLFLWPFSIAMLVYQRVLIIW